MADPKIKVTVYYQVGPRMGLKKFSENGNLTPAGADLSQQLIKAVGEDQLQKYKGDGKIHHKTLNLPANKAPLGSLLGNYFEYAVWEALCQIATANGAIVKASGDKGGRRSAQLAQIIRVRYPASAETVLREAQDTARAGAQAFWDQINLDQPGKRQQLESVVLEWMGGGGGIGDIKMILNNTTLMIECKYYQESSYDKYGIGYFRFSDRDGQFGQPFWEFLANAPNQKYWNSEDPVADNQWQTTVLGAGFQDYICTAAGGDTSPELLKYLLQKGTKYNVKNYFGLGKDRQGQRGIITGARAMKNGDNVLLTVDIDLDKLPEKENFDLKHKFDMAVLSFTNGQDEVATFSIDEDSQTIIRNNALNQQPSKDGKGWITTFAFQVSRNLFTPVS